MSDKPYDFFPEDEDEKERKYLPTRYTSSSYDLELYSYRVCDAAEEGAVLIKNDNDALPLAAGSRIALFGRSQFNYYKSGTGSGGLVNTKYVVSIADGLADKYHIDETVLSCYQEWLKSHPFDAGKGWAQEPWFQEEMPLDGGMVEAAAQVNDAAVIILGRTAGEDKDNAAEPGSYLLDGMEEEMIKTVCAVFPRTIVLLNVGNIIDMSWVEKYNPSAVLYLWQGGQEGGNAAAELLTGEADPSGKLTDTIAKDIKDYPSTKNYGNDSCNVYAEDIYVGYRYFETFAPDRVLYPFGFGLSYTTFTKKVRWIEERENGIAVCVKVSNMGEIEGAEVVQIYCEMPEGKLDKPARTLVAFAKTDVLLAHSQRDCPDYDEDEDDHEYGFYPMDDNNERALTLFMPWKNFASYDDSGVTGHKSAWVLEEGQYKLYLGGDVRSATLFTTFERESLMVVEQLSEAMAPVTPFERMSRDEEGKLCFKAAPLRTVHPGKEREDNLPPELPCTGDMGLRLWDVEEKKTSMGEFLAQLTDEDLCCIVRGEGMSSPKVTPGTAGAFGGVTQRLADFGIPVACCADGPSGIRMDCGNIAFSLPNGTCLASTWNVKLVEDLFDCEGMELRKNHIDTLLGPGINIHRNPLNGRNFEYFSEDPLLTGMIAKAQLKGMHKHKVTGTIKHFACNNQEHRRNFVEAVVSERALREIYLRGFEIAVKEGPARSVMTSYNPINGFWSASNYDLLTRILRKEWGYNGIVMTDWWAKGNDEAQPGDVRNVAAMVRAQNDLFMVVTDSAQNTGEDNSSEALAAGTVTRGEYLRSAVNICRFLLRSPAWERQQGRKDGLEKLFEEMREKEEDVVLDAAQVQLDKETVLPGEMFDTGKGRNTLLLVTVKEQGRYRMEILCRAAVGVSELAQIPMTVFLNADVLKTITITGKDQQWHREVIEFDQLSFQNKFYLKTYFGQNGMELKEVKISLAESADH